MLAPSARHAPAVHLSHAPHRYVLPHTMTHQLACARLLRTVQKRKRSDARERIVSENLIAHGAKSLQLLAKRLAFVGSELPTIPAADQRVRSGSDGRGYLSVLLEKSALDRIELHELPS